MNITFSKRSGPARGFTLIEALIVICVIAVLGLMTVPSLVSIVPNYQARKSTETTSSLMHMARTTAASTMKPIRAVVDCRTTGEPCHLGLYAAVFNSDAELTGWSEIPNVARDISNGVRVTADPASNIFSGSPANVFWAVFLPKGGLVASSHDPMNLIVKYGNKSEPSWGVSVDKTTGRVAVQSK